VHTCTVQFSASGCEQLCNCESTHTETKILLQQQFKSAINLVDKWVTTVKQALEKGDSIKFTWPGTYDGIYGHIVLSKKRFIFVEVHGFIHQTAQVILNLPYNTIHNAVLQNDQQLIINSINDKVSYIASPHLLQIKPHLELHLQQPKVNNAQTQTPKPESKSS
jgi:hypothetical protein